MGMFSWMNTEVTENITLKDPKVTMLIPHKFAEAVSEFCGVPVTESGIEGEYNGYGVVGKADVYDVTVLMNICLASDEELRQVVAAARHGNSFRDITFENLEALREAYRSGAKTLAQLTEAAQSIFAHREDTELELRLIGIDIACYDEQNLRCPYPIKMTTDSGLKYEDELPSMGDPEQGFFKYALDMTYDFGDENWNEEEEDIDEFRERQTEEYNDRIYDIENERDEILAQIEAEREAADKKNGKDGREME